MLEKADMKDSTLLSLSYYYLEEWLIVILKNRTQNSSF